MKEFVKWFIYLVQSTPAKRIFNLKMEIQTKNNYVYELTEFLVQTNRM